MTKINKKEQLIEEIAKEMLIVFKPEVSTGSWTAMRYRERVSTILEKAILDLQEELIEKVEAMQDRSQSSASLVWNDTLDQVIKVLSPTADKEK